MMLHWLFSHPRLRASVIDASIAFLAFWADPLGIADQRQRAFDNYIAVVTQYLRIEPPKELAVVLIDQDALNTWGLNWPIPYGKMADIIHELACARANGVFFDFSLPQHDDPTRDKSSLEAEVTDSSAGHICPNGKPPDKIPVFFGKIENPEGRASGSAESLRDWLDERGRVFLLSTGEDDSIYRSGNEEFPSRSVPTNAASPAFGLMRVTSFRSGPTSKAESAVSSRAEKAEAAPCSDEDARPQCWRSPVALVWGGRIDPAQGKVSRTLACRGEIGLLRILWSQTPWDAEDRFESCPPILTLRASDLERDLGYIERYGDPAASLIVDPAPLSTVDPAERLNNQVHRFVLVGVDLPGLNDGVKSPVHGYLPGVYKHAVALGSLIHYGPNYPTVPQPATLYLLVLVIYLGLEAIRHMTNGHAREHWIFAGCFLFFAFAFACFVYSRNWPASLIVAVFGYYAAVTIALFFSHSAKSQTKVDTRLSIEPFGGRGTTP